MRGARYISAKRRWESVLYRDETVHKDIRGVQGGDLGIQKGDGRGESPARDQHGETIHEEGLEFP